jgi:hypothetical protein
MSNLMASLEYVRAYIDDLYVITKGDLDDHLAKLEAVFIRLQDAGLKVNAVKSFLYTAETEYLGYPHKGWSKTSREKGTSNPCNKSAQNSQ